MRCHDADVYSDAANVLEVLHETLDVYMSLMQDSEENERDRATASASAPSSSLPTSAVTDLAVTRQQTKENVPDLLSLCVSVQNILRRVVFLARPSSQGSGSQPLSAPVTGGSPTMAAAPNEAVYELITRRLGDIVENADMIRGLVKLEQQQHQLTPEASRTALPDLVDEADDGPLRMKQLIRLTLYSLEDTEQLLRAAYPGAASTGTVARNEDIEDDRSTTLWHSSAVRLTLTSTYAECLDYNDGGNDLEGSRDSRSGVAGLHDPAGRGQSNGSVDGGANSSSVTPRSSSHTAPYVRRSSSFGATNSGAGSWAAPFQSGHNSDSDAASVRAWQADPSSAPPPLVTSAPKSTSPRVRFAIDERHGSEDHDSSLSERALAATVTPQQSSPCNSGLLSNPVVRLSSTDSDDNARGVNSSASQSAFCSRSILSGDGGDTMQPATLGRQRASLTSAQQSPSVTPMASVIISETESISTTVATPTIADARQRTVPLDTRSEPALADCAKASRLRMANTGGASSHVVLPSDGGSSPQSRNVGSSESGGGGLERALPPPVGLPPCSPRRKGPQQLSTSLTSSLNEERLNRASDPALVNPNERVTTQHVQRIPGDLWGVIIVRHRAEMVDVLREDVLHLFNYGEASPVLRNEDVRDVSFTVVGHYLYSRIQLEHLSSLAESEINTRLDLCPYPLMTGLYEEFFKERQVKELDSIEDNIEMAGNGTLHCTNVYSTGGGGIESGGSEEGKRPSNESVEQRPLTLAGHLGAAEAAADDAMAVARTSPLSIGTDPLTTSMMRNSAAASHVSSTPSPRATAGGGRGSVSESGDAASSAAAPSGFVCVEDSTVLQERAATASALRHPHTVRIPGTHWARLLVSPVPENSNLHSAFVQDTGVVLGVLPSEARAACKEVRFSCGSLVVNFVWDNAELYPGAVPLSAPEIDTALHGCPYPSVRAFYAKACAALVLDDDLAAVSLPNRSKSSGSGGTADCGALQVILPCTSKAGSSSKTQAALGTTATVDSIPSSASSLLAGSVRCVAAAAATASREAAPSPPPHQRGVHVPQFSCIGSAASNASAGAVPPVSVSPEVASHPIHSPKGQQRQSVRSPAGTPRVSAAPESSQTPLTVNQPPLFNEVSVSTLRQRNPALAGLDVDAVVPAAAAVDVPRDSRSTIRVCEQAVPSVASGAGHHRDPTDSAFAVMSNATPGRRTARVSPTSAHSNPKVAAAAVAPLTVSAPASPSFALHAPKPTPPQHHEDGSPSLTAPAPTSKSEMAKSSTSITVSTEKGNAPVFATLRRQSLPSVESVEKRCASLSLPTVLSANISAAMPAAAAATPASASTMATTRSKSPSLETPKSAGAKVPPAAVKEADVPAECDVASTKQAATFFSTDPAPTASSACEVSPRAPRRVTSMSTGASAGSRAPPAHIVYRLPEPQTSRAAEPRGVEAILAAHRIPRLPLDAAVLKAAIAANDSARGHAASEDQADHACCDKGLEGPLPLLERDLGLRLDFLTVVQVRHGSVAARAKIQPGDTLRTLDGEVLLSPSDFRRIMVQRQQRHREADGEHTMYVTAMTKRGTPATYRLRLPPPHCDGAATLRDVSHTPSARLVLPLATPRPALPLSARMVHATRSTLPQQQQRGIPRPLQASPRKPVGPAATMSARTRVRSLGPSPHGNRTCQSVMSAVQHRRTELPGTVHSSSAGVGGPE
ncbi:hypothetical protein CUR178_07039 [Leishmania enriettii]|uniref:Flagellar attachment zone protein 1 conserved domain-containing protein n=1 Tax=Leishmania enriettii TaxID=5663 RepID=A0A836KP70_LEIEN|nr:hypothetical protein CUR178_07039 [Leishmania enriettii]